MAVAPCRICLAREVFFGCISSATAAAAFCKHCCSRSDSCFIGLSRSDSCFIGLSRVVLYFTRSMAESETQRAGGTVGVTAVVTGSTGGNFTVGRVSRSGLRLNTACKYVSSPLLKAPRLTGLVSPYGFFWPKKA